MFSWYKIFLPDPYKAYSFECVHVFKKIYFVFLETTKIYIHFINTCKYNNEKIIGTKQLIQQMFNYFFNQE